MTKELGRLSHAVAAQLRAERAIKGMTLDELVEATGISKSALSNYLGAQRVLPLNTLDIIAQALGTDVMEIVSSATQRMKQED